MSRLELRHLRTLTALRDTGSLVEAAERVFLTQSALSHQLKVIETAIGCPVFVRKTRPLRFTTAGVRLLQLADEVLPLVRRAEADMEKLAGGQAGRILIAIECHSCLEWLLPAIGAYREAWPQVEMDVSSGFHFEPLPALCRGDLDLVITADPIEGIGLSYLPLFSYESQLAVAKDHRLAGRNWAAPEDLAAETLIAYPVDRNRLVVFTGFLDPAGVAPASVRNVELTAMMVQLAASHRGVVCLPNWALHEYLAKGAVAAVSLGEEGVWSTLYAAVREDQKDAPFMLGFIQTIIDHCFAKLVGIVTAEAC